jgi:hypothetical protein
MKREHGLVSVHRLLPDKLWKSAFWLQMNDSVGMDQIQKALRRT